MDIKQRIGQRIRDARKSRGLSQDDLAKHLEKTRQSVSAYENGTKSIPIEHLEKLAECLDLPLEYFFSILPTDAEIQLQLYRMTPIERIRLLLALMGESDANSKAPRKYLTKDMWDILRKINDQDDLWMEAFEYFAKKSDQLDAEVESKAINEDQDK